MSRTPHDVFDAHFAAPSARIRGAVDTFVIADDKIRLQTTVFTLEPVGAG
jgi:hypothetical protein